MSRESVLARAQAAAEAGMVDACTIRRPAGGTTDPDTGQVSKAYTTVYAGMCRFQQLDAQSQQHDVGEDYRLQLRMQLQLPMSATGFKVNDEVTCDTSRDPDMVSRQFLVRDLAHKTDASARRLGITERTD